ncbi:MAG: ferrochelatase [Xanthomonadales bacterium]|nr:ferrochelatase [Xanthomonadales bacterium]
MTHSFPHDRPLRAGVLLVNLGTPAEPTAPAIRRYLAEFLSDRRVVDLPAWLWRPILYGIILRVRPPKVARAYQSIWTEQGSPLSVFSNGLADRLQARYGEQVKVELAMSYGEPSFEQALASLQESGVDRLLVLPLYPQYSSTTTAAAFDGMARALQTGRWMPQLRFISHYHDDPAFIAALAGRVRNHWDAHGRPDCLIMSFHGIPERYFLDGDPYHCECQKTARLLAEALDLDADEYRVTFQSRFGREPWLQPYTDETLQGLPEQSCRHAQVICPGFAVDCLETLEEIAIENRDVFLEAGGEKFTYIPALNDGEDHAQVLAGLVEAQAADWPEFSADFDPRSVRSAGLARKERARLMGSPQ